jgi:hypothetical protein
MCQILNFPFWNLEIAGFLVALWNVFGYSKPDIVRMHILQVDKRHFGDSNSDISLYSCFFRMLLSRFSQSKSIQMIWYSPSGKRYAIFRSKFNPIRSDSRHIGRKNICSFSIQLGQEKWLQNNRFSSKDFTSMMFAFF